MLLLYSFHRALSTFTVYETTSILSTFEVSLYSNNMMASVFIMQNNIVAKVKAFLRKPFNIRTISSMRLSEMIQKIVGLADVISMAKQCFILPNSFMVFVCFNMFYCETVHTIGMYKNKININDKRVSNNKFKILGHCSPPYTNNNVLYTLDHRRKV